MTPLASCVSRRASRPARNCGSTFGGRTQDKTTAASPLPGWNPGGEQKRRRQPHRSLLPPDEVLMTLPARVDSAHKRSADTPLPIPNPPALDAAALIAAVLRQQVSDGATKVYAAMVVLAVAEPRWMDLDEVSDAAGMTHGRARQFIGELVRARLVRREKQLHYRNGQPTARNRYALAVIA